MENKKNQGILIFAVAMTLLVCTQMIISCKQNEEPPKVEVPAVADTPSPSPTPVSVRDLSLHWDELTLTSVQSIAMYMDITDNWASLSKAPDMNKFCSNYLKLSVADQQKVWAEFLVSLARQESSWNPQSESVDVGKKTNKDTWSVGLFQMSVVDQANLGIKLGYTYPDLKDPIKNITLAVKVMANQINKRGKIVIAKGEKGDPSAYWAPIISGGTYDKIAAIKTETENAFTKCKGE